jgi:hypothetical protein
MKHLCLFEAFNVNSELVSDTPSRDAIDIERIRLMSSFRKVGTHVSGFRVTAHVDNKSSISASLDKYQILPGIRVVPMSLFEISDHEKTDMRCNRLAEQIRGSGELMPLIVVVDTKGVYILEGSHRVVAMSILGARVIPALVVMDFSGLEPYEDDDMETARLIAQSEIDATAISDPNQLTLGFGG